MREEKGAYYTNKKIKVCILFFVLLINLFFIFSNTNFVSADVPGDYTVYWRFENNANDETGKYNGTVYGDSTYVAGKKGKALKLDGADDYMQSGFGYNLNPSTTPLTYSLWIKHYATGGNVNPIFLSQSSASGLSNVRMYLQIQSEKWAMGIAGSTTRSTTAADNNWHMITVVMDGTKAKMYVDGADIGYSKSYSAYAFNSYLRLGVYASSLDYDFAGEIDEAMIYQRALSLTEIQQIYCSQGGSASFCSYQPPTPTCTDGIKNQDETDVDCGGAKCSKCANNKICVSDTDCASNKCTGGKCVSSCINDAGCSASGNFCSGNIPYTCSSGADGCFDRTNKTACGTGYSCSNGNCVAQSCPGTNTSCGTYPNCLNCNNNDGCNGSSYRDYYCSNNNCAYNIITKNESSANNNCNDGIDNDCDGTKDSQDNGCVQNPPANVPGDYAAYWKFENNANDEKGNYNGAIYGNTFYIAGKKGQALKLDGDDDYMQSSFGYNLNPSATPVTYSLWLRHYAAGGNSNPVFLSQSSASGLSFSRMYLQIQSGKLAMGIGGSSTVSSIAADNNWHMITVVMDGTTAKMYVDGVDIGYSKSYSAYAFNSYLRLGVYASSLDYDFSGDIDEALVYQRALSLSEIQSIFCSQGGSAGFCTAQPPTPPATPTCTDGIKNQDETDVDCGGTKCSKCANEKTCSSNTDCTSNKCTSGKCVSSCTNDAGCTSSGNFCSRNIPYTCSSGADGCFDRTNKTACGTGYSCSNGQCVVIKGNAKDMPMYSSKNVFLISDKNWKEVLPWVSVAVWTGKETCKKGTGTPSDVCVYPFLIYHEESGTFDADSIIYFMQQYNPEKVTLIGNSPQDMDNLLISPKPFGSGLQISQIQRLNSSYYPFYWKSYDLVVLSEDKYEIALLASTYASLVNAPLIINGSSLDKTESFAGRKVICVGNVAPSGNSCYESYNLDSLQKKYVAATGTTKIIFVNPNDLSYSISGTFSPSKSPKSITELYSKTSLAAPVLASSKKEIILMANETSTDSKIKQELSRFYDIPTLLKTQPFLSEFYLTIISDGNSIPYKNNSIANDQFYYSSYDSAIMRKPSMSIGRIFGISISDVSSLISRTLFYNDIKKPDNASFMASHVVGPSGPDYVNVAVSAWTAKFKEVRSYVSYAYTPARDYNLNNPSLWIGYDFVSYNDHGNYNWAGIYSDKIPLLNNPIVFSYACSTCSTQSKDSFCANAIRQGAIAFIGAVNLAYDENPLFKDSLNNIYYYNMSVGEGFNRAYLGAHSYCMTTLIGDPTMRFGPKLKTKIANNETW